MRVTISKSIDGELHEEIRQLVERGFKGITHGRVEVHVKARSPKVAWRWQNEDATHVIQARTRRGLLRQMERSEITGVPEKVVEQEYGMSGRAYRGVPSMGRVARSTEYLVTLMLPPDPRSAAERYPMEHTEWRLKNGPSVTFTSWRDQLVHIAAHEANHIDQYREGRPRSEVACEHWARRVLLDYQAEHASMFVLVDARRVLASEESEHLAGYGLMLRPVAS